MLMLMRMRMLLLLLLLWRELLVMVGVGRRAVDTPRSHVADLGVERRHGVAAGDRLWRPRRCAVLEVHFSSFWGPLKGREVGMQRMEMVRCVPYPYLRRSLDRGACQNSVLTTFFFFIYLKELGCDWMTREIQDE